jgi:protein O-GlcNAc transferase
LSKLGEKEEAQDAFREAERLQRISSNSKLANGANDLACSLWSQGKVEEAVAEFRRALELNPTLAESHYNLGILLGHKGLLAEAKTEFQRAIQLRPGFALAYYNLGVIQERLAESAEAG